MLDLVCQSHPHVINVSFSPRLVARTDHYMHVFLVPPLQLHLYLFHIHSACPQTMHQDYHELLFLTLSLVFPQRFHILVECWFPLDWLFQYSFPIAIGISQFFKKENGIAPFKELRIIECELISIPLILFWLTADLISHFIPLQLFVRINVNIVWPFELYHRLIEQFFIFLVVLVQIRVKHDPALGFHQKIQDFAPLLINCQCIFMYHLFELFYCYFAGLFALSFL